MAPAIPPLQQGNPPNVTLIDDDGNEIHGEDATRASIAHLDNLQSDSRPWRIHEPDPNRPKFPTFEEWVRPGRRGTLERPPKLVRGAVARVVAIVRPRGERASRALSAGHRRSSESSRGGDSGDDGPAEPAPALVRGVPCPQCAAPLHTDRRGADHCGGCATTWWEGAR